MHDLVAHHADLRHQRQFLLRLCENILDFRNSKKTPRFRVSRDFASALRRRFYFAHSQNPHDFSSSSRSALAVSSSPSHSRHLCQNCSIPAISPLARASWRSSMAGFHVSGCCLKRRRRTPQSAARRSREGCESVSAMVS